jgi:hypothetical protein
MVVSLVPDLTGPSFQLQVASKKLGIQRFSTFSDENNLATFRSLLGSKQLWKLSFVSISSSSRLLIARLVLSLLSFFLLVQLYNCRGTDLKFNVSFAW